MSVLELLGSVLTELEKVHEKLDRLLAVGSARQTEEQYHDMEELARLSEPKKEPVVVEKVIIKGGTTVPKSEGIDLDLEYNGRRYKGKWSPCKYKCGALTSWPEDYKKGDQKLHVHPTDKEILGFAQEDMNGDFKCPMVVKK